MFLLLIGLMNRLGEVVATTTCRSSSVCKTYFGYWMKRQLQLYLLMSWQPYDPDGISCLFFFVRTWFARIWFVRHHLPVFSACHSMHVTLCLSFFVRKLLVWT
jgi:hypothetical protein